ncbi:MAG: phosphoglucosamine mutase [Dehalococcoidales bacterium]|nr:phosphoglucosamine mutase [Dehalococcoidales bacterium]
MTIKILTNMRLFGTSGIRRVADSNLIQLALKVGLAVGKLYSNVIVSSDTRTSGEAMKHAFISGLLTAGSNSFDAGIIPTPTLALAAREFDAAAMITASHNPPKYNGIKLLNPDGSAFNYDQQQQIEEMVATDSLSAVSWDKMGSGNIYNRAVAEHIQRIERDFPDGLKLKVVLDCDCGAASVITPYLLKKLGCEVVTLNCYPSGFFPHPIEPTEANLNNLMQATSEHGADLGIAHDGDADRMMAVDDKGRFIPGDKLLVLFAEELGVKEVITTIDASMAIDETGLNVIRTSVGDNYISEELKKGGKFGGEPSGSWVFSNISLCPDGIYAAVRLAAIAVRQKLSYLVDNIPQYPLLRGNIGSEGIIMPDLEQRLMNMKALSVNNKDGIKLNFEDGWLLIRASGTEPKIRITVEAKNEVRLHQLYDEAIRIIRESSGRNKGE